MKHLIILAALVAVFSCQKAGESDELLGRWELNDERHYVTYGEATTGEADAMAATYRAQFLQFNADGDGAFNDRFVTWKHSGDSLIVVQPPQTRRGYLVKSLTSSELVLRCGEGDRVVIVLVYSRPLE